MDQDQGQGSVRPGPGRRIGRPAAGAALGSKLVPAIMLLTTSLPTLRRAKGKMSIEGTLLDQVMDVHHEPGVRRQL